MSKDACKRSGSSPHPVSGNGAPVLTGHRLEDVKRRIMEAFASIHHGQPAPAKAEKQLKVYGEEHKQRFHAGVKAFTRSALTLGMHSHVSKARHSVYEIVAPQETAEDLFKAALGDK